MNSEHADYTNYLRVGRERCGMEQVIGLSLTLGLAVFAGVVWLIRLEGRINGHDDSLRSVKEDLHYIRERIDRAIDGKSPRV